MFSYKDVIVKATPDDRYFGIKNGMIYWLCAGGLITCDCPCDKAGEELRKAKNVKTLTWAGKIFTYFFLNKFKNIFI